MRCILYETRFCRVSSVLLEQGEKWLDCTVNQLVRLPEHCSRSVFCGVVSVRNIATVRSQVPSRGTMYSGRYRKSGWVLEC